MIIGITGGIGSGKSTIARALAARGYAVYDCDHEAKRIIAENKDVQQQIIALLGEEAFIEGGYNTAYVAQRVFREPELLERLNQIVHPAVKEDILEKQPDFVESAILYEAGLDSICDKIFVIDAPEDIRIARTIARDYHGDASPENINKVRARIRAQQSSSRIHGGTERGFILINDGRKSIDELAEEIIALLN
ncbi:MAG: dephospho-CoA kinase [Paludibacteraceae bacterium]|nr:dephospho-CoA kinase [Paludibacteraceae bacterium]